ncbi:MAG TPA: MetS family NSS transporter small subunit [Thermoanaerobacterales bacterium]|nr:MetS family NSS transporter small subunit [Thermoanaerobacterales bacterium]
MAPGSLIMMIIVLGIAWGGTLYFLNMAMQKERK